VATQRKGHEFENRSDHCSFHTVVWLLENRLNEKVMNSKTGATIAVSSGMRLLECRTHGHELETGPLLFPSILKSYFTKSMYHMV
jgi:hypothetical protein